MNIHLKVGSRVLSVASSHVTTNSVVGIYNTVFNLIRKSYKQNATSQLEYVNVTLVGWYNTEYLA